MDTAFLRGLYLAPPTKTVCGLTLEPLSLHHLSLLMLLNHPLVVSGSESGWTEDVLTTAALVCSTRWPGGRSRFFPCLDASWAATSRLALDFLRDRDTFEKYWEDYWTIPQVVRFEASRPSGAPMPYLQAAFLLSNFSGFSEEDVWNMPLPRVFAYRAIIEEASGATIRNPMLEALARNG